MTTRRDFLRVTTGALGGALVAGCARAASSTPSTSAAAAARGPAARPIDLLVLGGTGFIGPHLVRHAVARGHRVTIFTRGRRTADLPAGVERLVGDRNGQLDALRGRRWDAVIDDSATNPEWVRQSTALLKDSVGRYLFTSSTGVYYPYLTRGVDESTPVRTEADDPKDGSATFGVAKARCERVAQDAFGARALVVRPTYIVGPGDTTDRFPYWPVRLARGGETLAPGRRDDAVQIVDVRDLAEFMVTLVEQERSGIYNAAGPAQPLTFGRFLEQAAAAVGSTSRFVWIDDYAFLEQQGITEAIPWVMLKGNDVGHTHVRNGRAIAAGLGFRPLADTVRDTLAWWPTVPEARRNAPRFAIRPEQEVAAIAAWKARGGR
ncbi:MAG: NAD-dependent epimerase/dehydratase family protein [Gemmatirosa sp.]